MRGAGAGAGIKVGQQKSSRPGAVASPKLFPCYSVISPKIEYAAIINCAVMAPVAARGAGGNVLDHIGAIVCAVGHPELGAGAAAVISSKKEFSACGIEAIG